MFWAVLAIIVTVIAFIGMLMAVFGSPPANNYDLGTRRGGLLAMGIGGGLAILFWGFSLFTTVDAGEVVVPVQFGEVLTPIDTEGISMISPFAARYRMPVRTTELTFEGGRGEEDGFTAIQSLSSEGATVDVDLSVLYHIEPGLAGNIYRTVGTSWESTLVIPYTRSAVRDCVPTFSFEEARTSKRAEVSDCIEDAMNSALAARGLLVEAVLIRDMRADENLQRAIDQKLEAQSAAQRAEFEQREAEVRAETIIIDATASRDAAILRAEGEAESNRLVAESLSDSILQLRTVEALGDKAVIFFGGEGAVPLIQIPTEETP